MQVNYNDDELIAAYREWSEEYYAAGFLTCDQEHAERFVRWLTQVRVIYPMTDYERDMLALVRPLLVSRASTAAEEPTE